MGRKLVSHAEGRSGRVFADSVELCVKGWDAEESAEEFETTSTCSQGFYEFDTGVTMLEGNVEADWDISQNPFDTPGLRAGKEVVLKLYEHATPGASAEDGPFWAVNAIITRMKNASPNKGTVTYGFSFKSNGTYSRPTGNPSSGI